VFARISPRTLTCWTRTVQSSLTNRTRTQVRFSAPRAASIREKFTRRLLARRRNRARPSPRGLAPLQQEQVGRAVPRGGESRVASPTRHSAMPSRERRSLSCAAGGKLTWAHHQKVAHMDAHGVITEATRRRHGREKHREQPALFVTRRSPGVPPYFPYILAMVSSQICTSVSQSSRVVSGPVRIMLTMGMSTTPRFRQWYNQYSR